MARKLRLEYEGACYHVVNRGNYRTDVFRTEGARVAFEDCLFEACVKSGWLLHAFATMRNHFHLALETPGANLVGGMQWLQSTFANRFNRLRDAHGHLFQGRYYAGLVEPGWALGQVCDYIHLNPVRAGVVTVRRLGEFRHSSYWYLQHPKARPGFLRVETALTQAGGLVDTPAGRRSYADYLAWQAAEGPAGKGKAYVCLSKGWALGTEGFKAEVLKKLPESLDSRAWEGRGTREAREARWEELLVRCLRQLRRTQAEIPAARKSAPWKVATAAFLKERTQATNGWLCAQLAMGTPVSVSRWVGELRRTGGPAIAQLEELRAKVKA
jgi:putative transposase